jgi:hypothetical protein
MIKFELRTAGHELGWCDNEECEGLPQYINKNPTKTSRVNWMKAGTIYLSIIFDDDYMAEYCGGCIDQIYQKSAPILNRNLWAFR